ncbi:MULTISPECIES: efflux RND transporter permease subunit [Rahnella]|jgi:multidrug efflux pump|uniref:Efflux pump membrane transporter n=1 Tax=Rahnella sp. (strain Y9602) TaxID=2703885 RepID=A0A0H3F6F5_RAHSY|nr:MULTISPECIES: efflux RND transporter permease subunit [Rahnella]AFE57015.1 hydrophobe/amphiphile efflux-1 (HAE1) family transporter [Rahnella aquatilis HX2]AYA05785.1 multidrug efflux RND transporter permease subunit [Rahnella aquatilis]ADW72433.1 transporter, hydrophobe/amphiphile efflux-1 (HAE1) family [Rahnella aceris]AZP49736.1 efflux RND transporter permease subunit [Rahnella aquatilis]MBU9850158.1 efflux RND transporter permease subunit [Rahnella aceris]
MSTFFINRPIFAWVVAIVIMLAGALSIMKLPISQYPNIAPPAISVSVTYPGASAETAQNTVVQVIEQQLNGLDNLRYIESQSNSDGSATIIATFDQGTNPDIAQVQVQNKVSLAESQLPTEVVNQGIRIAKYQANFMLLVSLISTDGKMSNSDLSNLLVTKLEDPIVRTKGVGDFLLLGSEYAMRIWLDPAKLYKYQLVPSDVSAAIEAQNVQVSSGSLGGLPTVKDSKLSATIIGKTRFDSIHQFKNVLLKVNADGSQVRLSDVGNVDLGPESYSISSTFNGRPSTAIALRLASGANVLDTDRAVRETIAGLEDSLPAGVKVEFPYQTAPVVSASIEEVVKTLIEAIVLVFCVMLLFLQNLRATLVTTLVVPVVLLGTFGILAAAGYSINTLTMFGMVLAIGLLVDDAIVVVENVERVMTEEKLSPKDATIKSMKQIQGALFGIALVLSAVLVPMAFFGGSTGIIYRQFSITIVSAMALSVLMALIFTPALCATIIKHNDEEKSQKGFAGWFNRNFDKGAMRYTRAVGTVISRRRLFMGIYLLIVIATGFMFTRVPTTFLPDEDQAVMFVQATLPANASAERTQQVLDNVREYLMTQESGIVSSVFTANGFSFAGRGQNVGIAFVQLKTWADRPAAAQKVQALAGRAMAHFATIKDARVFAFVPPAVMELGNATGFDFFLQDTNGKGHEALMAARNQFLQMASQDKRLMAVRPNGMEDEPQYQLEIDDERAQALGLSLDDINNTLSAAWGSAYVNQFMYNDRVKRVYIQGKAASRVTPEDLNNWYFRNSSGDMVPWSAFGSGKWVYGSPRYERFNGVSSVELMGSPAPGYSSGDANEAVMEIAAKLPPGYKVAWHGLSYEEKLSGSQTPALYSLSMIVVFLCLAALYESWSIPFSVMLVVPLGILGTIGAVLLRGLSNDVFFQVGLLTTVGLAAKNAILIVEFAKELHENEGMSVAQAAIEAAKLRIRPIIMTSMAFVLGVFPLTISSGAGAGSQHSIGTAVVGGMLTATFLAIFFVPMFYVTVVNLFTRKSKKHDKALPAPEATHHE